MPSTARVRPVALAAVRRGRDLLVAEGVEPTGERFFRPLGGGIEFGERAVAAVRRELREELAVELEQVRLLGVLEDVFDGAGRPCHEIVFVFGAALADPALYQRDDVGVVLDEGSRVSWRSPTDIARDGVPLYPRGLAGLLAAVG
ncbi:NUDIX hydrolase [Frankia canadensis]|uniref:NUDIX hydrolase n=1 Tax=Frankia canadensis TaxID=1836972 RepID=A0A2I2KIM5_9ACTN|nr:NUDIX domain-containing protein [Frankia canadensis]SNQ45517.1 NUDIX hydrolase [Frankia canadensis]SOU52807.1 NUDIX hydrolase [Frankia canadensis]